MNVVLKNRRGFRLTALLLALAVLALVPASARAQYVAPSTTYLDPSTLHIGGTVPTGGGDPNSMGSNGVVNVYNNPQSQASAVNGNWVLIVGIANDLTNDTSHNFFGNGGFTVSWTATNPYTNSTSTTGTATLGGSNPFATGGWDSKTGFVTNSSSFGNGSNNDAYTIANLPGTTNSSESLVNWQGGETKYNTGVNAANFGLYVFTMNAPLGVNGEVSIRFPSGTLPIGSYAIAYGQGTKSNGQIPVFDTPFTESGIESASTLPVSAPSSAVLAGLGGVGLLGCAGLLRRRRPVLVA